MINRLKKLSIENEIYIWGSTERGIVTYKGLSLCGVKIVAFFDNAFPDGGKVKVDDNIFVPIMPLNALDTLKNESTYFVLGSLSNAAISQQLKVRGFDNIIFQCDIALNYANEYKEICFDYYEEPEVSVLITAYNHWEMTYECLKSLKENGNECRYEVILGDNCSTDCTRQAEKYLKNVKVIHHQKNLQFLGNANAIAKCARGKYLFLLANDICFTKKKYIDVLLEQVKKDKKIGMITGKCWVPYKYKYDVHYIYKKIGECEEVFSEKPHNVENMWPVATIIPKNVWDKVGGFDEAFLPVCYEDTDLEMRIIHAGYDLVAYPDAEVIHYGGGTYKIDYKSAMWEKNSKIFRKRWQHYIEEEIEKREIYLNRR